MDRVPGLMNLLEHRRQPLTAGFEEGNAVPFREADTMELNQPPNRLGRTDEPVPSQAGSNSLPAARGHRLGLRALAFPAGIRAMIVGHVRYLPHRASAGVSPPLAPATPSAFDVLPHFA